MILKIHEIIGMQKLVQSINRIKKSVIDLLVLDY